jgi:hypothetical protein
MKEEEKEKRRAPASAFQIAS